MEFISIFTLGVSWLVLTLTAFRLLCIMFSISYSSEYINKIKSKQKLDSDSEALALAIKRDVRDSLIRSILALALCFIFKFTGVVPFLTSMLDPRCTFSSSTLLIFTLMTSPIFELAMSIINAIVAIYLFRCLPRIGKVAKYK